MLSLYLQRSYLLYCKHVTANPRVRSASAERSGSKHMHASTNTICSCVHAEGTAVCSGSVNNFILIGDFGELCSSVLLHSCQTLWPLITAKGETLRETIFLHEFVPFCQDTVSNLMILLYSFKHFSASPFLFININDGRCCARFVNSSDERLSVKLFLN